MRCTVAGVVSIYWCQKRFEMHFRPSLFLVVMFYEQSKEIAKSGRFLHQQERETLTIDLKTNLFSDPFTKHFRIGVQHMKEFKFQCLNASKVAFKRKLTKKSIFLLFSISFFCRFPGVALARRHLLMPFNVK